MLNQQEDVHIWRYEASRLFSSKSVCKAFLGNLFTTGILDFAECRTLCRVPFVGHSAKTALPRAALGEFLLSVTSWFTECKTLGKDGARQRAVSGRHKADGRQPLPRAEGRHSAKNSLPSVFSGHSAKLILFFRFCPPNFLWYVLTLCRPTCIICGQL
jgi:hypothetical protein